MYVNKIIQNGTAKLFYRPSQNSKINIKIRSKKLFRFWKSGAKIFLAQIILIYYQPQLTNKTSKLYFQCLPRPLFLKSSINKNWRKIYNLRACVCTFRSLTPVITSANSKWIQKNQNLKIFETDLHFIQTFSDLMVPSSIANFKYFFKHVYLAYLASKTHRKNNSLIHQIRYLLRIFKFTSFSHFFSPTDDNFIVYLGYDGQYHSGGLQKNHDQRLRLIFFSSNKLEIYTFMLVFVIFSSLFE